MGRPTLDLRVHLEQIVRLSDQCPVAHELLLRPISGGALLAEAAAARVDMAWVTAYALKAARAVLEHASLPLHVNITPGDLARPSFVDQVRRQLTPKGMAMLVLEVTEQDALTASDQVDVTLLELRRDGVRFAIDDYGDGRADMASVEAVQPEIIKVRLANLRDATGRGSPADTLAAAALRIGAHLVVEQVETPAHLDEVRAFGITHGQGWLWDGHTD